MIVHLKSWRAYVGCASNVERRIGTHRSNANSSLGANGPLGRAMAEYGTGSFFVQPVVYVPVEHGEIIEAELMAAWSTLHPGGFNVNPGAKRGVRNAIAGLNLAKERGTRSGRPTGRPRVGSDVETAIRARLSAGDGILKVAREVGAGSGTVQRVRKAMEAAAT